MFDKLVLVVCIEVWTRSYSFKLLDGKKGDSWQQPNYRCVIGTILRLKPKHSTVPAIRKKINSIAAKTRTLIKSRKWQEVKKCLFVSQKARGPLDASSCQMSYCF